MRLLEGNFAPDFKISTQEGSVFSLKDYRGQKVILYFYPKDNTPGCIQEACDFKDAFPEFATKKIIILGISKDPLKSHKNFSDKYNLPFYLGSDPTGEVLEQYDVLVEKSMYGRKYKGIERTTFLIDENGQIKKIWRSVKVKFHVKEILECLSQMII